MRKLAVLAGGIAIAAAACSSGPTTTSGTETITGTATGQAAAANLNNPNQNAPLGFPTFTYAGPVNTSVSSYTLPGGNGQGTQTGTLKTPAGNLVITHTRTYSLPNNAAPPLIAKSGDVCIFGAAVQKGTYVVDGSKSTGKFHNATGHGNYAVTIHIGATMPKGKTTCNIDDYGQSGPTAVATGSSVLFKATGPLTVSS